MEVGKFRRGIAARDGKIYLFEDEGLWVLRGWPRPMAWRKTPHREWRHVRPTFPLTASEFEARFLPASRGMIGDDPDQPRPSPGAERQLWLPFPDPVELVRERGSLLARQFFAEIPDGVLQGIRRCASRHWHLLALTARCPGADDLLHASPAIAWCLASSWIFHQPRVQRPLRSARALVRKRQREIVGWLGFPGTEATVRLLRRIPPAILDVRRLLNLRTSLLQDPSVARQLAHTPLLNVGILDLLGHPRLGGFATSSLLAEIAAHPEEKTSSSTARALHAILKMRRALGISTRLAPFRTRQDAQDHMLELARELRFLRARRLFEARFPPPPVPGIAGIRPLLEPREVVEEAHAQRNCVRRMISDVAGGRTFLYAITEPERATLSLVRHDRSWVLGSVLASCNREVSSETLVRVQGWLRDMSSSKERVGDCPF